MANPEHLAILEQGVEVWNQWRKDYPYVQPELSEVDIRKVDLSGIDLSSADLQRAYMLRVNLDDANLTRSYLSSADIRGTSLRNCNLTQAILGGTNFFNADLENANFSDCILLNTLFNNVDLSRTIGLESVKHNGPSTIGMDTIYKSGGKISPDFLFGCGLPPQFIYEILPLIKAAKHFQNCFLSYSTRDEEFAQLLFSRLREAGVAVWYSPVSIKGGKRQWDQIEQAIESFDRFLLVLSESSIESEWVKSEIRKVFELERRDNKSKLFPISLVSIEALRTWKFLDADTGADLAFEVRNYFIPDFSNWRDSKSFEEIFERLLNDLQDDESDKVAVTFTTSVVFDEEEHLPAFIIPQIESLRLTSRLSDLSHLGKPLSMENGNTVLTINKPGDFDEVTVFCGELLQYKILTDISKLQRGGWSVTQTFGTVSSEVGNPVKTSDMVKMSQEDWLSLLSNNRFSNSDMERLGQKHSALLVPLGTTICLQHLASSEKTGADKHLIIFEKVRFFKAEVIIQTIGASSFSILPPGLRLSPEKAKKCRTYHFTVTLKAEFENLVSGTRQAYEYRAWLKWLFSEIQKKLSD